MTPYGNRDFERATPAGVDEEATAEDTRWEHDAALSRLLDRPARQLVTRDTRRVVVRLHGGDEVEVGRTEGREPAVEMARDLVRSIDSAEVAGEWPLVSDRFLRPGAIVSIDVQRAATA